VNPEEFYEKLETFEGAEVGEPSHARDAVNEPMIRHWCDAMDDRNPVYTDEAFANGSVHGSLVAPPTMLQAWTMRGLRPPEKPEGAPGPQAELFGLLDSAGFTSVVATNCTQEYTRYLKPGDRLTVKMQIESVSPEKQTGLGAGHFVTQLLTYRDQDDEVVAEMRFRMLKFKPRQSGEQAPAKATPKRQRPRPGVTRDGQFWWDGVQEGKLLIQRCAECQALRHPPGPMCPKCQSLEWDTVEASGRGHVYSFVVFHHPAIPPFEYPNVIALVELEEGVRLISNLVGVSREEARIGMAVQGKVTEVEEGLFLPQFHPAES
jgi:uncharacterized OB-fold protein/acyl dehydratase